MEVIDIPYTEEEKAKYSLNICPKQLMLHGVESKVVGSTNRLLELLFVIPGSQGQNARQIAAVIRKAIKKIVTDESIGQCYKKHYQGISEPRKYLYDKAAERMGWNSQRPGHLLAGIPCLSRLTSCRRRQLESPGSRDVMKESARIARSFIRSVAEE